MIPPKIFPLLQPFLMRRARGEPEQVFIKLNTMTVELEETKQNLQKAIDEGMLMATCLSSLQHELQQTKCELQQLKQKDVKYCYRSIPYLNITIKGKQRQLRL